MGLRVGSVRLGSWGVVRAERSCFGGGRGGERTVWRGGGGGASAMMGLEAVVGVGRLGGRWLVVGRIGWAWGGVVGGGCWVCRWGRCGREGRLDLRGPWLVW